MGLGGERAGWGGVGWGGEGRGGVHCGVVWWGVAWCGVVRWRHAGVGVRPAEVGRVGSGWIGLGSGWVALRHIAAVGAALWVGWAVRTASCQDLLQKRDTLCAFLRASKKVKNGAAIKTAGTWLPKHQRRNANTSVLSIPY